MKFLKLIQSKTEKQDQLYGVIYYNVTDEEVSLKKAGIEQPNNEIWYTSTDGNPVTPYSASSIQGSIINITSNAWDENTQCFRMVFDGDVHKIGTSAFTNCSTIETMILPDSVTSIGERAFRSCSSLTSVTIPDSITSIGNGAFYGCSSLTSVIIPDSVNSIGEWTFSSCSSLTSVTIPDSVTTIEDYTFDYCSSLTSVTIPDSITSIGNCAFRGCKSLTSVGEKGSGASIEIPNSVTILGSGTFDDCSGLISVTIPNSIKDIKGYLYGKRDMCSSCDSLLSVTVGSGLTELVTSALRLNPSLKEVILPSTITTIGDSAFYSDTSLTSIHYNGTIAQWNGIPKSGSWKSYVPSTCIVHCTDGDINI